MEESEKLLKSSEFSEELMKTSMNQIYAWRIGKEIFENIAGGMEEFSDESLWEVLKQC